MIRRPSQNYNIENRAMKALDQIEKTKPIPAPRHPTSSRYIDDIARGEIHICYSICGILAYILYGSWKLEITTNF